MTNLVDGFDANTVEPQSFEPLPVADYTVILEESEEKATQKGDGKYLNLKFKVIDGEFKNRYLFDRLVLDHPNPLTVQIARGKLSALCRAVNVLKPKDSAELHNIPLLVKVTQRRREDTDEMTNDIKAYKPLVRGDAHDSEEKKIAPSDKTEAKSSAAPWKKK